MVLAAALAAALAILSTAAAVVELPLYHFSIDGAVSDGVFIEVEFGTPPSRAAVLLDTGSSTLAIPSQNVGNKLTCPSLFGDEPSQFDLCGSGVTVPYLVDEGMLYDSYGQQCVIGYYNSHLSRTAMTLPAHPNASNNFTVSPYNCQTPDNATNTCVAFVGYGQGTTADCMQGYSGVLGTDILTLGSPAICVDCTGSSVSARVSTVDIQTIESGFQEPPCSGIFGVGPTDLNLLTASADGQSGTKQPTALDSIITSNNLPDEISMCMGNGTVSGRLLIGGTNSELMIGDFTDIPMSASIYYGIKILRVGVTGAVAAGYSIPQLPSDAQQESIFAQSGYDGPIVDSGTPELVLPEEIYNPISNALIPCNNDDDCTVTVTVEGVGGAPFVLNVPGVLSCDANIEGTQSRVCGNFNQYASDGGATLGYAVLRNYYTVFRRTNRTFGFATPSARCKTSGGLYVGAGSSAVAPANQPTGIGSSSGTRASGGDSTGTIPSTTKSSSSGAHASGGDDTGIIVGAVVGGLVLILLGVILYWYLCCRSMKMSRSHGYDGGDMLVDGNGGGAYEPYRSNDAYAAAVDR